MFPSLRLLLAALVLLVSLPACGGGGSGGATPGAAGPELVAVFPFDMGLTTPPQHLFLTLGFGAHTPDSQSSGFNPWPVGSVNANDIGTVLVAAPGGPYYETLAALTDGQNSSVGVLITGGVWTGSGAGVGASENGPFFQKLDPTPGIPDLAGFVIDAIHVHVEDIARAGSPVSASWSVKGRVLIFGSRLP